MRDKMFQQLLTIVEIKIEEIREYFTSYCITSEKRFDEMKTQSYGGYEIKQCVREFEESVSLKSTELLTEVNHVIVDSNRHFSQKQISILIERCSYLFAQLHLTFLQKKKREKNKRKLLN